ncbi:MAG: NAD(P)/FAD-dependent oxidoreductase [Candidatus Diapherotrites archaeon]
MYMAAVVGAGPAGISAAKRIRERGWSSILLEEHPKIGDPVACTGLISVSGTNELGIRKEVEENIVNKIRGAKIYSPSNEMLEVKRSEAVAYVIDRGSFDMSLAESAKEAGVEIRTNTKLIDVRKETIFVEHKGRGELVKAKVVVGADGVNSKMRKILGINTEMKNYVHAYQVVANGSFEKDFVKLYFGDFAKNFFAWVVPENEEKARVGLATTSGNVRRDFEMFCNLHNFSGEYCNMCSKLIYIGEPLKGIVKDNIALVGEAAGHVKATTGGGILLGIEAAQILGDTIHKHFSDKEPLANFEQNISTLNKELLLHWKIRQFINNKSEEQIDDLFRKMNKANFGEFLSKHGDMDKPSRFVSKALSNPSLWRLFPEAVKFLMT